jgi:hypothetical protein
VKLVHEHAPSLQDEKINLQSLLKTSVLQDAVAVFFRHGQSMGAAPSFGFGGRFEESAASTPPSSSRRSGPPSIGPGVVDVPASSFEPTLKGAHAAKTRRTATR